MRVETLHDDEDATIDVRSGPGLARLVWKRPVSGTAYREVLTRMLDVIRSRGLKLWLSDSRLSGPIDEADQVWTMQEYTPQVIQAGLLRIAIVNSEDALNRAAVDRMVKATPAEAPYAVAYFLDPSIAQLWLMDPSRTPTAVVALPGASSH